MYLISNSDMEKVIKYLGMMIAHTPRKNLSEINAVRVAGIIKKKLETKQPLPTAVADEIKILSKKCLQGKQTTETSNEI